TLGQNYSIVQCWKVCCVYWGFGIVDQFKVSLNGWILLGKRSLPNSNQLSGNQKSSIIRSGFNFIMIRDFHFLFLV
ncbi:hypothetical protein MKW92_018213, partial [Papaver armeniacum]